MTPLLISICVFLAATFLIVGVASQCFETFFRYRSLIQSRVEEECQQQVGKSSEPSLFKDVGNLRFDLKDARQGALEHIRRWLIASGTGLQLGHMLAASVVAASVVGTVALVLKCSVGVILVGCVGGAVLPVLYIESTRRSRRLKLRSQLPEAFNVISRAVRAGRTMPAAIQSVADEMTLPLSAEFAHCFDQQQMGISLPESLRQLAERTGVTEMKIFAVGLTVQAQSGGNVVELLENLSTTVRKRQQQRTKMKAITAESRMQALVVGALPMAAFTGLSIFAPDYIGPILAKPKILACTLCSQAVGAAWIRAIVRMR